MQNGSISVIGLGKLGLCLAASFAKRGIDVLGVDVVPEVVNELNQGRTLLCEPGLPELLAEFGGKRLRATLSHSEAIEQTDISCIMVHTPSDDEGHFSNQYVLRALTSLGRSLRESSKAYHLFIINSTVMPGSMENEFIPLLENTCGRKLNEGFGLCYSPELVALGSVVRDFLRPDVVAIGSSDERAGRCAEEVYRKLCENNPPIFHMSLINAEIFKVSLNCYVTLKISFANALANLCERIPGAHVDAITRALGVDRRIGPHYLQGGLAFGGTCFPRDTRAYIVLAKRNGLDAALVEAAETVNRAQDRHLADLVLDEVGRSRQKTVAVLGLAFKPSTNVIVESPAIKLIDVLVRQGVRVNAYDPLAIENTRAVFGDKISYLTSARECFAHSDVCVITTQAKEFKEIDDSYIVRDSTTIFDCWRLLDPSKLGTRVNYVPLGIGLQAATMGERKEKNDDQKPPARHEVLHLQEPSDLRDARAEPVMSDPLLTIVALPRPFRGHYGVIQRNAILNWARLSPKPEIILFGNEEGTAEIAQELGLRHVPSLGCNEYGTPLLSDLFEKAQALARADIIGFVNADIMFLGGFMEAVQRVASWRDRFLMVGRRNSVNLDQPELYDSAEQEQRLRALVEQQNLPIPPGATDYFVFPRGQFVRLPQFAVGRGYWDNWVLWESLSSKIPIVDASGMVLAVHQNHEYSPGQIESPESRRNFELAGRHKIVLGDATSYKLTPNGVASNFWRRSLNRFLSKTRLLRHALGIRRHKPLASVSG
jgi:UDPglucose 6-dehydrogenase